MAPSTPFVDRTDGTIDTDQVLVEAIPIAKLVALVVAVALVPFVLAILLDSVPVLGMLFAIAGQFTLAVGSGIVLIYVITRAIDLADGRESPDGERQAPTDE